MRDSKKDAGTLWIWTGMFGLLLLYPVSFGPACWLANSNVASDVAVGQIYAPFIAASKRLDFSGVGINPVRMYAGWFGDTSAEPFWYWYEDYNVPVAVIDPVEAAQDPFLKVRMLWRAMMRRGR